MSGSGSFEDAFQNQKATAISPDEHNRFRSSVILPWFLPPKWLRSRLKFKISFKLALWLRSGCADPNYFYGMPGQSQTSPSGG